MGAAKAAGTHESQLNSVHVVESNNEYKEPEAVYEEHNDDGADLVRSASFTALIGLSKNTSQQNIKRTFSENVLNSPAQQPAKVSSSMQNANIELFRRASRKTRKRMSVVGLNKPADEDNNTSQKATADVDEQSKSMARSVSGTIRSFARKSWMPNSRINSPSRQGDVDMQRHRSNSPKKKQSLSAESPIAMPERVAARVPSRSSPPPLPQGSHDTKSTQLDAVRSQSKDRSLKDMHARNQSMASIDRLSRQSSRTSLGSRGSGDGLYLGASAAVPPVPISLSSDKLSNVSVEVGRKKDPLWSAFRSIEGEWTNFQSKTSMQKAKVIRTVLLPFLSRHANEPSNHALRAEDLDRRVVILSKWWTGLLELLSGRSNQSISGTDRPAFLEAILEIMERHEWRIPPFQTRPSATSSKQTSSIESDESDFLLESIHQNVRNIFVQNLLSQMAYVVDKLSMRSAPASLVTFSGKTCAFAFFFCPGVGDILVRLWHIPAGVLRRLFSEYGALHNSTTGETSTNLSHFFPPPVRSLAFTSQSSLTRHLHPKAQRPAGSASIRWYGPWVNRWIGRDSDLFFVFVKYYHLLVCKFYPTILSKLDRLCIPGFAPVHAQMLIVLESTIYRHVGHFTPDTYSIGETADAMIPLPMSIPNATRSIAENRLVVLLRDVVGDTSIAHVNVCTLIVESFGLIMQAAAKKTPMYNSDAAVVLCDLVEEIFPICLQYEHSFGATGVLDWPFWIKVFQYMMQSETCTTQIRVIALVYSIWPVITSQEKRKRAFIIDWILEPAFFGQIFNHWSPMVRHYFFRLLCWRVGRCNGEGSELDIEIFQTFALRLNTAWAHHLYLVAEADMRAMSPPSSNPCSPAPGRTLIIIRMDNHPSSPSTFSTFDKILSRDHTSYASQSDIASTISGNDAPSGAGTRKWNLLRTIKLFGSSPSTGRPGEVTPPSSPEYSLETRSGVSASNSAAASRPGTPPHQPLCFKFSLDYTDNRPQLPAKNKKVPAPLLPVSAQKLLDNHSTSEKLSTDSIARVEVSPKKPQPHEIKGARYSGRALAEWAQVRSECRNFYIRRKQEGCPKDSLVETPMMAIETFRMFG